MSKHPVIETNLITPHPGATSTVIGVASIGTLNVTRTATFDHNVDFEGRVSIIVDETQLNLGYDGPNHATFDVGAAGILTIDATGHSIVTAAHDVISILNTTETVSNITGALMVSGGISAARAIRANDFVFRAGFPKREKVDISASLIGVSASPATMTTFVANCWAWTLTAAIERIRCSGLLPNCRMNGSPVSAYLYWAPQDAAVDDVGLNVTYSFNTPGVVVAATATDPVVLHTPGVAFQTVKSLLGTWTPAADTDAMFHCEIARTGDYVGKNVYILGVELLVQVDKLGGI